MVKKLLIMCFALGGMAASAAQITDASCLAGGCLTSGWTAYDYRSATTAVVECHSHDCLENGWTQGVVGGGLDQTAVCEDGGCMAQGWRLYQVGTGRLLSVTHCLQSENSDAGNGCLTSGWVTSVPFGGQWLLRCKDNDCGTKGWSVTGPRGLSQTAVCKPGGCFVKGWTLYQP